VLYISYIQHHACYGAQLPLTIEKLPCNIESISGFHGCAVSSSL